MSFLWPDLLWGMASLPALVVAYLWLLRRRKRAAVRYASLSMVRQALGSGAAFRRHIPPGLFLLAVALMALMRASIETVVIAITVPEIPRVVRLVRSLVLVIREQPYVQAAEAIGTRFHWILLRHVLPNAVTPLIVQGTFICASAVLFEAYLSFLGAGTPPEIPSWGNMMAEGRAVVQLAFNIILFPGIFLGLTVLSINLLGDGLRDMLDPKIARRL